VLRQYSKLIACWLTEGLNNLIAAVKQKTYDYRNME